jgi:succinate-acetate transporter protein
MASTYPHEDDNVEKGQISPNRIERLRTAGGHIASTEQPSLPVVHRRLANPAPLGLLSFATGIFLISILGVQARGIQTPNILVGVLMFFGGICQFISGIMEFVAGNTFGATVFPSYAAFNFSYAMIYIPGTGIISCKLDTPDHALPNTDMS